MRAIKDRKVVGIKKQLAILTSANAHSAILVKSDLSEKRGWLLIKVETVVLQVPDVRPFLCCRKQTEADQECSNAIPDGADWHRPRKWRNGHKFEIYDLQDKKVYE